MQYAGGWFEQESQRVYGTADIRTETCDRVKNLKSLPFIGTIFYLNQFTQNITYLITPFHIHMPIAEGINIARHRSSTAKQVHLPIGDCTYL